LYSRVLWLHFVVDHGAVRLIFGLFLTIKSPPLEFLGLAQALSIIIHYTMQ
jgi:hypothetical protein